MRKFSDVLEQAQEDDIPMIKGMCSEIEVDLEEIASVTARAAIRIFEERDITKVVEMLKNFAEWGATLGYYTGIKKLDAFKKEFGLEDKE